MISEVSFCGVSEKDGMQASEFIMISFDITGDSKNSIHNSIDETKITLVLFVGGCTYAEISALRFLSQREDG